MRLIRHSFPIGLKLYEIQRVEQFCLLGCLISPFLLVTLSIRRAVIVLVNACVACVAYAQFLAKGEMCSEETHRLGQITDARLPT